MDDMEFVPVVLKTIDGTEIFALIDNNRQPTEILESDDDDSDDGFFSDVHLFVPIVCKKIFHFNALHNSYDQRIAYYAYLENAESDNVVIELDHIIHIEPMKMTTFHVYSNLIPRYYSEDSELTSH